MIIESIPISKLRIKDSRFVFIKRIFLPSSSGTDPVFIHSMEKQGIWEPVVLWKEADDVLHVVKGFNRVAFLISHDCSTIPGLVLSDKVALSDVFDFILSEHHGFLKSSAVAKVKFILAARDQGVDREIIIQRYLPWLGLGAHETVLRRCEKMGEIPAEMLDFFQEKQFSLKQCLSLSRHPVDVLSSFFEWQGKIFFSASVLEELLDNLGSYLKLSGISMTDFRNQPEIRALFEAEINVHERTIQLREFLRIKRYPVLSRVNEKFEGVRDNMLLPPHISLQWDKTLEDDSVWFNIKVRNIDEWKKTLEQIGSQKMLEGLEELFKEL